MVVRTSRGITPRITSSVNMLSTFTNSTRFSRVRFSMYRRSASASFKRHIPSIVSGVVGGSDWWRLCDRRIVAYLARAGHRAGAFLGFTLVEHRRLHLDDRHRSHSVADPYANHQSLHGGLSGRPTTHEMGEYPHGRSVFPRYGAWLSGVGGSLGNNGRLPGVRSCIHGRCLGIIRGREGSG